MGLEELLNSGGVPVDNMSDQEAADWCNEKVERDTIKTKDVVTYLFLSDKWLGVYKSNFDSAFKMRGALDFFQSFDLDNAQYYLVISSALDDLISDGLLTSDNKNDIMSLGDNKLTRAEKYGLGFIRWYDVKKVRSV